MDINHAPRRPASMIRHNDESCPNEYDTRNGHLTVGDWIHCTICHTSHQLVSVLHTEIVG